MDCLSNRLDTWQICCHWQGTGQEGGWGCFRREPCCWSWCFWRQSCGFCCQWRSMWCWCGCLRYLCCRTTWKIKIRQKIGLIVSPPGPLVKFQTGFSRLQSQHLFHSGAGFARYHCPQVLDLSYFAGKATLLMTWHLSVRDRVSDRFHVWAPVRNEYRVLRTKSGEV